MTLNTTPNILTFPLCMRSQDSSGINIARSIRFSTKNAREGAANVDALRITG